MMMIVERLKRMTRQLPVLLIALCLGALTGDDAVARRGAGGGHGGSRHGGHGHVRSVGVGFGGLILVPPAWSYREYLMESDDSPIEYIEQGQTPTAHWYYCREANAYYPETPACPGGWLPVAPTPPAADVADAP